MTSIETGQSWSERLNPRNWTLTVKLVVVGIVPALLAFSLGILRVSDQAAAAGEIGRSSQLLEVQERVAGTADSLRQERDEATLYVAGGRAGNRGVLEIGFSQSEAEVEEMLSALQGTDDLDATTLSAMQQAEGQIGQLPNLRTDSTDNPGIGTGQITSRYTEVVNSLDVLDRALLRQLRTPGIGGLSDALTAATNAVEQLAVQHTLLGAGIRAGALQPGDANSVVATDNALRAEFGEYQVSLTPQQLTVFGNFLDDAANAQRERLKATILATPPDQPITVPPYEWDTAYNGSRASADRSADMLRNELVAQSVAAEEQASNLAGVNAVVLMLGLLIGIAVAVLIARALIRSLRVLRASALDVADRRLPQAVESMRAGHTPDVAVDPVPLTGRDEVGQVARAFDAVHGQAVRLAAEQAALQAGVSAMFVNLSRRSQALVERQLQLIEQLESNEQDADQLSNLFQLDHLATRMRRNSENLLVLAGTDLAKRNIAPVPMVDVLRAAVSEVESYQRVVVQTPPTATVAGRAASDVVHLLAELLDNATNFSPPDSQVVMSTARASDGSIVVEIADRGVGMAEHELADANQRMSGPSSVDVSASRRMGLFVVGRLASRHGIGVRLSTSAGGQGSGLTASVAVPAHLIPSIEPVEVSRTASLPLVTGAGGGRAAVPPQRGVNGARSGGLSALIAGTDGPANPTGVFDAPAGGDGQLFTPPPGSAGGAPPPPTNLPSRRPGSTLRPGTPPGPPEGRDRPEPSGAEPAEEQAREVAAQARRDQEAAARAEASRAEEQAAPWSEQSGTDTRNGHPVNYFDSGDQPRTDRPAPEAGRDAQAGQPPNGQPAQPPTAAGLPRRMPSRSGHTPQPPADEAPAQQEQQQPAADSTQADSTQADSGRADSGRAQPPALQPRPAPLPRRFEPQRRATRAQGESEQAGTGRPDQPSGPEQRTDDAAAAVSPPTMPMPAVRRPAPAEAAAPAAEEQSAAERSGPQPAVSEEPAVQPAPQAPAEPAVQEPTPQEPEPEQPAAQQSEAQQPEPEQPEAEQPEAQQPAAQPAPRPTPRPTPRPFRQNDGIPPAAEPAAAAQPEPADADTLFAPSVPVIAEPTGRGLGNRPSTAFDLGETTPIFEEIASAWFRSNRPIPVTWETDQDGTARPEAAPSVPPAPPRAASPQPAPRPPAPSPRPTPTPVPPPTTEVPVVPAPTPRPQRQPISPPQPVSRPQPMSQPQPQPMSRPAAEPEREPEPAQAAVEQEFASMADEGWRAASGAVAERQDEVTAAGLPKRRPRARLVPGSAGSAVLAPPAGSTRSAESIRGRLASYQQGVRQGRESRMHGTQQQNGGTGPANAGGNHHDEESS